MSTLAESALLTIDHMGRRGEGIAFGPEGRMAIPYTLPGETVHLTGEGERGMRVLQPSPDRVTPFCPLFGACGGCAIQHWAATPYEVWKRDLVVQALMRARIDAPVAPLVDAHGAGRRRATLHARVGADRAKASVVVGYMAARSHDIVPVAACPILAPGLAAAPAVALALAQTLAGVGKPLDIVVTETQTGLDVSLRGSGPLAAGDEGRLIRQAAALDLARLANHDRILIERRTPTVAVGTATVMLPPGAFLQATHAGEMQLAAEVRAAIADARRVGDLFAGIGTFALPLAETAHVHAVDSEPMAVAALTRAARAVLRLLPVTTEVRDLFTRPLAGAELAAFDAVVLDPPRAGAEAQARALAASAVPLVVSVSCSVDTFARDAAILVAGGYALTHVVPVDQFRHSSHVEIVGTFRRPGRTRKTPRRLLG